MGIYSTRSLAYKESCNLYFPGEDQIVKESRDCWANILNIIFNHGLLFTLLHELYKVICDPLQQDNLKLVSALWIQEILEGLMELETVKQKLLELSEVNQNLSTY